MTRLTSHKIQKLKYVRPIRCLTAYTSSIAKIVDQYVDIILVGDSVGTVFYGMKNTQSVTLEMMKMHAKAVTLSSKNAFTIVDMPYKTYSTKKEALKNAVELLQYTKCQSVKLETDESTVDIVAHLVKNKIKVISHIGVTPQKYKNFNKIRSVGKNLKQQNKIIKLAKCLENVGSSMIVLECIRAVLAKKITKSLRIPTIGIGSSVYCDGQVLVTDDILNMDPDIKKPRFVKSYNNLSIHIKKAVKKYAFEVIKKKFPKEKNSYN